MSVICANWAFFFSNLKTTALDMNRTTSTTQVGDVWKLVSEFGETEQLVLTSVWPWVQKEHSRISITWTLSCSTLATEDSEWRFIFFSFFLPSGTGALMRTAMAWPSLPAFPGTRGSRHVQLYPVGSMGFACRRQCAQEVNICVLCAAGAPVW